MPLRRPHLGVLGQGQAAEGSLELQGYNKLRASLKGENLAARLYAEWLKRFLDAVERFCDDADTKRQRAFGLKKPAPLWTAPAFDRCLLLAFIYPIATIVIIWVISGDFGPAEAALSLSLALALASSFKLVLSPAPLSLLLALVLSL